MVALSGSWGRLAPSLVAMVDEADALAPGRSRVSDGSVGDLAHQERSSYHNPLLGFVDALDLTHDPLGGFDAHTHARKVADRRDPRIAHIISLRRIWTPSTGWQPYRGPNPHDKHAHFAVLRNARGRADTASWFQAVQGSSQTPEVHKMWWLLKFTDSPTIWITDFQTKRALSGPQEYSDLAYLHFVAAGQGHPMFWTPEAGQEAGPTYPLVRKIAAGAQVLANVPNAG